MLNGKCQMRSLISEFEKFDLCPLQKYAELISSKNENGEFFPPYIPLIGKNYEKFKILIYATAQNIAHIAHDSKCNDKVARRYSSQSRRRLVNRLYYTKNFDREYLDDGFCYKEIDIAPCSQGFFPVLAGIFIYTLSCEVLTNFDSIQDHIAVSNYYKFSLHDEKKDINPKNLGDAEDYWDLNDKLVSHEIGALKPNYVFAFRGRHERFLRNLGKEKDFEFKLINDPAWILRGASGCLKPQGSWGRKTHKIQNEEPLKKIIENYLKNLKSSDGYKNSYQTKKEAIKIYLLKYFLDWQSQM